MNHKLKAIRAERNYWKRIDVQAREERVVCFLQNAWSPLYAGRTWPRESWLRALRDSRSGKRLRILVSNPGWCHNTTPVVGDHPSSKPPADLDHVIEILKDREPKLVIACGKQAEEATLIALDALELPGSKVGLVVVPHPAARVLTDNLYEIARAEVDQQRCDETRRRRIALRQRRGYVENYVP